MRRLHPRRPRGIGLLVLILLALFLYLNSLSASPPVGRIDVPFAQQVSDRIDDSNPLEPPPGLSPIEAVWYPWSKIIFDNRPKIDEIRIRSEASNIIPKDGKARVPYRNLITNSADEIIQMAHDHDNFVEELNKLVPPLNVFSGYGIVMVGGDKYYGPAITTIRMIRRMGCTLPIEVFVKDASEYENYMCNTWLPSHNARCLIITDFLDKGAFVFVAGHYQLKVLALLFSSFRHVLFLDSDSIPLTDPLEMMQTAPYTTTGLVLWSDFWGATESPVFYNIAGMVKMPAGLPKTSSESGELLFDKQAHLQTLLLIIYYNIYGPGYYYPLLSQGGMGQGDKETFMAAAIVLNNTYYRVKTPVEAVMNSDGVKSKGHAMLQANPADDSLHGTRKPSPGFAGHGPIRASFLHANTPKMNAGRLVKDGHLFSAENPDRHIRLYGDRDTQLHVFGYDIEETLFTIMVESACEIGDQLSDWVDIENVCDILKEHYDILFANQVDIPPG